MPAMREQNLSVQRETVQRAVLYICKGEMGGIWGVKGLPIMAHILPSPLDATSVAIRIGDFPVRNSIVKNTQ